jgi:hypothetical protein
MFAISALTAAMSSLVEADWGRSRRESRTAFWRLRSSASCSTELGRLLEEGKPDLAAGLCSPGAMVLVVQ